MNLWFYFCCCLPHACHMNELFKPFFYLTWTRSGFEIEFREIMWSWRKNQIIDVKDNLYTFLTKLQNWAFLSKSFYWKIRIYECWLSTVFCEILHMWIDKINCFHSHVCSKWQYTQDFKLVSVLVLSYTTLTDLVSRLVDYGTSLSTHHGICKCSARILWTMDYLNWKILTPKSCTTCSLITPILVDRSFWSFTWIMMIPRPNYVHNYWIIRQFRYVSRTNEILQRFG